MKSTSILVLLVASLTGCATGYYESFGPKSSYHATAVTRPAVCNDFPVAYKVQVPETDERIRPIDRSQLSSSMNAAFPSTQCHYK
jgi:hypothetical protein